jgi:hypothetical protein
MTSPNEDYDLQKVEALFNLTKGKIWGKSIPEMAAFFNDLNAEMDKSLPNLRENFEARVKGLRQGSKLRAKREFANQREDLSDAKALRSFIQPQTPEIRRLFQRWCFLKISSELSEKEKPVERPIPQPQQP